MATPRNDTGPIRTGSARMGRYYSTFPAGFDAVIRGALSSEFDELSVKQCFDNAVLFTYGGLRREIASTHYFQNVYEVIDTVAGRDTGSPGRAVRRFTSGIRSYHLARRLKNSRGLRLVVADESRLVSIDNRLRSEAEARISDAAGVPIDNKRPDAELWVIKRREGIALFLLRKADRDRGGKRHNRGDRGRLSPEIGALLCRLSEPADDDVFLDPFCGKGGIVLERVRRGFQLAFAEDIDPDCVRAVKDEVKLRSRGVRKRTFVRTGDARDPARFENGFVTKIVTDPPWGEFDRSISDVRVFYVSIFKSFARVLCSGGTIVLLVGREIPVAEIAAAVGNDDSDPANVNTRAAFSALLIEERHDVLVSGRKASVYKLRKQTR